MNPLHPLELYVNKAPQEQSSRVEIKKLKNFFRENAFCFKREHIELLQEVRKALPLRQANLIKKINKIILDIYCFDEKEERSISSLKEERLKNLQHLKKNLQHLNLSMDKSISNDSMSHLKNLSKFKSLNLEGCSRITDHRLRSLENLPPSFLNFPGLALPDR